MSLAKPSYTILPLEISDLFAVGTIHCEAFPQDVRSQLGPRVVARYFSFQLEQRNDVHALGAFDKRSGALLGFCFGGRQGIHANGWVARHLPHLAPRLLMRPHLWRAYVVPRRIGARLAFWANTKASATQDRRALAFEIFSLAVQRDVRNRGIGKALMRTQEDHALSQSCVALSLTCPVDKQATIAFYQRLGFQKKLGSDNVWAGRMLKAIA